MLRGLVITAVYLLSLAAILFLSAGRVDWPLGWASIAIYVGISAISLVLADRELVAERSQAREGIQVRDAVLAGVSFLFFFPLTLFVAGLDAGRFSWSPPLPLVVEIVALVTFGLGNALGCWAIVVNRFFSTFVRIQEDRGHEVVSEGPYRYVRHPGYAGAILAALALPLALGSLWALIPAFIGAGGFVVRTAVEDGTLREELRGYREYARRVRHRLIPGIW